MRLFENNLQRMVEKTLHIPQDFTPEEVKTIRDVARWVWRAFLKFDKTNDAKYVPHPVPSMVVYELASYSEMHGDQFGRGPEATAKKMLMGKFLEVPDDERLQFVLASIKGMK